MNGYKCTKCGETASSKCVRERSVFPSDGHAALMTNVLKAKVEDGWVHLMVRVRQDLGEAENTQFLNAIEMCQASEDVLRHWACNHQWQSIGECNFGCCKPGDII
jgi:translation initiation factor 2 gamma subunit (eIF-2gamma)